MGRGHGTCVLAVRWVTCTVGWQAVFCGAARGFGRGSEMTWTFPTRNPVIPLLGATITRDARSSSFWPFLSNFSLSDYEHLP